MIALGSVNPSGQNPPPTSMHEAGWRSRQLLLRQVADVLPFSSLLDIGKGRWVEAAFDAGAENVWNLHIGPESTLQENPRVRIHRASQDERWVLERRFDIAVAFGVDDGHSVERATDVVTDLCALSDVVLFSSVDPLQAAMSGAVRSWPEAWALLFRDAGFSCFDLFGRQPSLIDEPELVPPHAVLFVRRGTNAAERLDPWSADGLRQTYYTPDAVISIMENAGTCQWEDIERARRSYHHSVERIATPLGSGFLTKDTPVLRRLRRELDHARSMIAIEHRGVRISGERLKSAKEGDADRLRLGGEFAYLLQAEISALETESQRLRDLVAGFRQAYFRHSMDRRSRFISFLLPGFLKIRWHKRCFHRAVDEIRRSTMFDAIYYLTENPDVKLAGMDPAEHYFISGAREGRNPSAQFNTTDYIFKHQKGLSEGVNPLLDMIRSNPSHGQ